MIARTLEHARAKGELALVAYLTAGHPTPAAWLPALERIATAGADILEIGIPFSDPIADGPTIARASSRSLARGTTPMDVLDAVRRARLPVPSCVMSYLNPLLALGSERIAIALLARAGVAGLIVPDLPAEEAEAWRGAATEFRVDLVGFVAPTSTEARVRRAALVSDVLYYVAVTGVTGARPGLGPDVRPSLERVRRLTDRPVVVGFGIGEPDQIRALRGLCDGVVVGSRIVEALGLGEPVEPLVRELARAAKEG